MAPTRTWTVARRATEDAPRSYLYFIACGEGLLKVGRATDVAKRLSTLQVGNAQELRLLLAVPGNPAAVAAIERRFHAEMRPRHVRGEWFQITPPELLDFLEEYAAEQNWRPAKQVGRSLAEIGIYVSDEIRDLDRNEVC